MSTDGANDDGDADTAANANGSVAGIDRVAVLGAGNMGHGIAEVIAMAGYEVTMRDVDEERVAEGYERIEWSLEKLAENGRLDEPAAAVLGRIETAVELEAAVAGADLVIEAAPERMELKRELFADLDELAPEGAILASNTSSLSITEIAASTDRPERVCGLHFFNPPVKMELVEVIHGAETSEAVAETAYAFVESIDRTPIHVRKDVHGFVVNAVLGPFITEPAWMVSEDEATIRAADAAMVHERGYPMGPFELSDMTGIDVSYHVREEAGLSIPPIMAEKVEAGDHGRKSGRGYYEYEGSETSETSRGGGGAAGAAAGADYEPDDAVGFDWLRVEALMVNRAAAHVGNDVATPEATDTGMRLGTGFPEGPCRRGDALGLDRVLAKLKELRERYGDAHGEGRYEPADHLVELVERGDTGEDAGTGFYEYEADGSENEEDGEGEREASGTARADGGDAPDDRAYVALNYEHRDDGLLAIELDRPDRLNALNGTLREEIVHLLEATDEDAVRAVTFEGAGDRAFCAGADIGDFSGIESHEVEVSELYETVAAYPRPTLARIDGYCLGGGLELALACDLRIATEGSSFGFPEIDLGLLPGGGGTQRAARMLTEARAKELVFRGSHITAGRAEEWGLINRAVPEAEFAETVGEFLDDLLSGPPVALRKAKQVIDEGRDGPLAAGLRMESQAFGLLLETEDAEEGTAAFAEDREPEFRGR